MVVDDDTLGREYLCETLKRNGHAVVAASDGQQAIAKLTKERCDVIFLDMKMPGMCGMDVLEKVKAFILRPP